MDYQAIVRKRLQKAHQQLIHLHPAPHEYLFMLNEEQSLKEMSNEDRGAIVRILLANEVNAFFRELSIYFNWDLSGEPPHQRLDMTQFIEKRFMGLSKEKRTIANWLLEKVIPYCNRCEELVTISTYELFLDAIHLVEQLSFITEQIADDYEARLTWIFDWFHTMQSDVEYYGLLRSEKKTETTWKVPVPIKKVVIYPQIHVKSSGIKQKKAIIPLTRGERKYGQTRSHVEMANQKRTTPKYSVSLLE